jgi:hypothetical protein
MLGPEISKNNNDAIKDVGYSIALSEISTHCRGQSLFQMIQVL